jgi:hypothetical protein
MFHLHNNFVYLFYPDKNKKLVFNFHLDGICNYLDKFIRIIHKERSLYSISMYPIIIYSSRQDILMN